MPWRSTSAHHRDDDEAVRAPEVSLAFRPIGAGAARTSLWLAAMATAEAIEFSQPWRARWRESLRLKRGGACCSAISSW